MGGVEYIIVGDTEKYEGCLIYTCGKSLEHAEDVLNRMLNAPTNNDLMVSKEHTNLRVEEVDSSKCWWNDPYLCN